ncbi:MAG: hypothetical protein II375_08890 [Bacteroidales bacterium]|nr:hypothetical protein [Bacteroidales bacterium]
MESILSFIGVVIAMIIMIIKDVKEKEKKNSRRTAPAQPQPLEEQLATLRQEAEQERLRQEQLRKQEFANQAQSIFNNHARQQPKTEGKKKKNRSPLGSEEGQRSTPKNGQEPPHTISIEAGKLTPDDFRKAVILDTIFRRLAF